MKMYRNTVKCRYCHKTADIDHSTFLMTDPPQFRVRCSHCSTPSSVRESDVVIPVRHHLETIQVKKTHPDAIIPTRTYPTDAGLDLYALEDTTVSRGTKVRTGIAIDIPEGYEGMVRPRSGMTTRTSARVQIGTIDAGYRGEISIIVDAIDCDVLNIPAGTKLAQIVISPVETPELEVVTAFEGTSARGEKGFGHSDREVQP